MEYEPVGMIGLGLMGTAITERLIEAGYTVLVWNRTRKKAAPLLACGAHWADNPLSTCDRAIVSLYTTDTVEQVLSEMDGGLRSWQILIDTTTGEPAQTARLGERLAQRGVRYLDAPISGSSEQTRRCEATAIVGGPRETYDACGDLFRCLVQRAFYAGPWGSGAKMKLISNLVLGLNRAALAEGLVFAKAIGIDPERALEILMGTMAYSRIMDTKGRKMLDSDFSVQARLSQHLKDIRLILDAAVTAGQPLPLTDAHRQLLEAAETAGFGDADNSAIIRAFDVLRDGQPLPAGPTQRTV
jgi:3-hydroxyisobutyrate dehydrogenase-like beta-hydroxyacid dehydrogenase